MEGLPNDVEDLIMSMQRSIPFEFFDPHETLMSNTVSGCCLVCLAEELSLDKLLGGDTFV